jgi:hypothetical protein
MEDAREKKRRIVEDKRGAGRWKDLENGKL